MDTCDECGFAYDERLHGAVALRISDAAAALGEVLVEMGELAGRRPAPERWSAIEYAAHVRDVLLTLRDRLVVGLVEDRPGFKPMYRDERIAFGLYAAESVDALGRELQVAATLFGRLYAAITPEGLRRTVVFGYPEPHETTVGWMGLQVIHESEHHLADVRANLALLRAAER